MRYEHSNYHNSRMQKELVVQKLRGQGCRITKQRLMLLDIILEEDFSCCKEIYYRASKLDSNIGSATVSMIPRRYRQRMWELRSVTGLKLQGRLRILQ